MAKTKKEIVEFILSLNQLKIMFIENKDLNKVVDIKIQKLIKEYNECL